MSLYHVVISACEGVWENNLSCVGYEFLLYEKGIDSLSKEGTRKEC